MLERKSILEPELHQPIKTATVNVTPIRGQMDNTFAEIVKVKTGMVPFFAMCLEALYVPVEMCKNRHFLKTTMAVSSIIPMKLAQRHLGIIAITMG